MSEYKFWMVYVEGASSPTKHHWSYKEAYEEAERLVTKTGKQAYLLESVGYLFSPKPKVDFFTLTDVAPMAGEQT